MTAREAEPSRPRCSAYATPTRGWSEDRGRLAAWREGFERESARLAEWERSARASDVPVEPRPATFEEGLRRLSEPGAARRSSW